MGINQFFYLADKLLDDDLEIIMNKIAKAYNIKNRTPEIDKEDIVISKVAY